VLLAAATLCAQTAPRAPYIPDGRADVLYYNGKIITGWDKIPVAEALAIGGGRILAVGETQVVGRHAGPRTRQVNLEGKTMLPGLIDSHVHPIGAALAERDGEVPVMRDFAELRAYVERAVQSTPASQLVFVPKVYSTRLKERRYPTRWELDKFSGSHKVMLDNGYASALNSAALAAVGITRETPQPDDGKIIVDAKTGEPSGLILGARRLVRNLLQHRSFTHEDRVWAVREMHKAYNHAGLTSVIDRSQGPEGIRAYQELWEKGELTVRTNITITLDGEAPLDDLTRQIRTLTPNTGFGDDFMRIGSLKIFLDGGILIGTAYLRTPYGEHTEVYGFHDPDYRGVLRVPPENITAMAKLANRLGWQMTAHTTGGASTDALLDAYEAADREQPIRARRFTLTHANFPDARAIERAKKLGVLMDLQPAWYHLDGPALATVLGPERMKDFHPYKSIFDAGVIVAGGSDHMIKFDDRLAINPYNPFFGMWMVVTRKTTDGTVYNPEQKISREQALRMWTWNAAYVSFDEQVKGSIEPGKLADLVIIDRDYLTCPEDEIKDIQVLQTILGGKVVYDRSAPK
jgi:hypothetical protein